MANNYVPRPVDTTAVELAAHLLELTELLARHTHDVWAGQRMGDGWTWGPARCDASKKHPCLVPYEELPEGEKEYDRKTAVGALKVVISCGYEIRLASDEKDSPPAAPPAGAETR